MNNDDDYPTAHFGAAGAPPLDWRRLLDGDDDDGDDLLPVTPPAIVKMLGFDPRELDGEEAQS